MEIEILNFSIPLTSKQKKSIKIKIKGSTTAFGGSTS